MQVSVFPLAGGEIKRFTGKKRLLGAIHYPQDENELTTFVEIVVNFGIIIK